MSNGTIQRPRKRPRIALVLGGGALKGFAHLGALRALQEAGVRPRLYSGSSIGALIAAGVVGGTSVEDMIDRAVRLKRRDLFRINHVAMLLERMAAPAIYLEAPLRELCEQIVPEGNFENLPVPLLVTAVDALIAVDVGVRVGSLPVDSGTGASGFAAVFMRAAAIMMHAQQQHALETWSSPPMLLVRPAVSHISWFNFGHTEELIDCGYRSMKESLRDLDEMLRAPGGIFPRKRMRVSVDRESCTGFAICVARAPHLMALDDQRKAYPVTSIDDWSPADGDFVRHCPVDAIHAVLADDAADGVSDDLTVRSA